ncbi:MAG TPA: FtsW/RodA/SpoVE family cell cycle protein [Bryobacteraceae bacterium]|jgi:cell division protein FtsI/penicillin-binding protein 2/cell division protein FtsW (lipid II flippase)|nr:FtsW/RodA/SpoVE family cell cycle protein [Bryobacteraceae bacterium]
MAVTNSWDVALVGKLQEVERSRPRERRREFWLLLLASAAVSCGLALVFAAKTQDFPDTDRRLANNEIVNLNQVGPADRLLPILQVVEAPDQRAAAAQRIESYLDNHRPVANVGVLARLRVPSPLPAVQPAGPGKPGLKPASLPLVPLAKVKPLLIVRTPKQFLTIFAEWCLLYLASFWVVHFAWRLRKFRGDPLILPALHVLTGLGLILMVSLRDPLRDTLEFKRFAWGVAAGCAILLLPLLRPFQYHNFTRWIYTPLLAAFGLFVALIALGSGPTGSDAKVNLGPFQPVEIIKILIVFFMAGYFAQRWEWLRDIRQKTLVPRWLRWIDIPHVRHALPVMCAVACGLAIFFLLKDMGPALVMGFVFLSLFAIARGKLGLATLGIIMLVAGVAIGYHIGAPHTVVERVSMWMQPWDNDVRGGDQLAHALWAFATGGPWGSGPGWGDPSVIPAGHTDLVLPALAEEWGFCGVVLVALLIGSLVYRAFRIALRSPDEYGMFLGIGLGTLLALEMLLISGGVLGAIPLSGVVSPFLSSGNTAMLSNFLIFAVLLSISNQTVKGAEPESYLEAKQPFRRKVRILSLALVACMATLLLCAINIEVLQDRDLLVREAHVITQDGVKRPERNPRLNLLAASIPRGNIYDRNGVLLATSNWNDLEKRREQYNKLGISIDAVCSHQETRHYPFGPIAENFLGDLRTGARFHASNASLIERDSAPHLQGYASYDELAPVVRYRHRRGNPLLQNLLNRNRDIQTTVDIRLQQKAAEILKSRLEKNNKRGAIVVLQPVSGDVLAMASWPEPTSQGSSTPDELFDRARYGEYPPGSTFKLVTAIAALRLNPKLMEKTFSCRGLGDGRSGTIIPGWRRPIRDDVGDHAHGTLNMGQAITVSCNAYFAQLGVFSVGAQALHDTAEILGIDAGEMKDLKKMLPFAAYGQGTVVVTPFKMARVAATVAAGGSMPQGRWVLDSTNARITQPELILAPELSGFMARSMRAVVTSGTGRTAMNGVNISVAGKTGTAQLNEGDPHSWFAGFAPYDGDPAHRIAFAVVVEHGGYGAKSAAPIAREIVEAAEQLGIVSGNQQQAR